MAWKVSLSQKTLLYQGYSSSEAGEVCDRVALFEGETTKISSQSESREVSGAQAPWFFREF